MYPLVPAHRILQPFRLREAYCRLDMWTHVVLTYASIKVGHEDNCGDLLNQRPIPCLEVRRLDGGICLRYCFFARIGRQRGSVEMILEKYIGQFFEVASASNTLEFAFSARR